jgi:hypothetical protein
MSPEGRRRYEAQSVAFGRFGMNQLRCRDEDAAIRFQDQSVTLDLHMEEIRMSSQVPKLAAAGSFGIALLGLYLIFNSTGTPLSLAACTMFIVGTVVGVMLMQSGE